MTTVPRAEVAVKFIVLPAFIASTTGAFFWSTTQAELSFTKKRKSCVFFFTLTRARGRLFGLSG